MSQRKRRDARRRISGFLASVLAFVFVFEQFFVSLSYAGMPGNVASASDAVRSGRVSLEYKDAADVQMAILSDEASYEAGDTVCLDVFIKNNTDQDVTDGSLKFKAKGILEDSGYFEDVGTVYQELLEEMVPSGGESSTLLFTDGGADSEFNTKDEGDNGEMSEMDEEKEALGQLTDLTIAPGEVRYVQFYFTIDDSIEGNKSQSVDLTFQYDTEETRNVKVKETFRYSIGAMNLMPVEIGDQGKLEAGEKAQMLLDFELGEIEDWILEKEMESEDDDSGQDTSKKASGSTASSSQAKPASSSNAWIKWAADSATSKKKEEQPIIKNLKCTVKTNGVKLKGFSVEKQEDDDYGTSTVCTFQVDENTKPGIYYGEVTATYQIKSKKFQTTQGFQMIVSNDSMELEEEALEELDDAVAQVIALIDELPTEEEVTEKFAALDEDDEDGYERCYQELYEQVNPVWKLYHELTEEQKEQVTNSEKLLAFSWLMTMPLATNQGSLMITFPRGTWPAYKEKTKWGTLPRMLSSSWWYKGFSNGFTLHLNGKDDGEKISGQIAYCIEPGVTLENEDSNKFSPKDEDWWKNGLNNYDNEVITTEQMKTLISRVITEGYHGTISSNWKQDENKEDFCRAVATQILVWETVVGEREDDFSKKAPTGSSVKGIIKSNHPWRRDIYQY